MVTQAFILFICLVSQVIIFIDKGERANAVRHLIFKTFKIVRKTVVMKCFFNKVAGLQPDHF